MTRSLTCRGRVTQLLSFGTYFIELYQGSYIIDIFDIPGSALYVNSLLAVLNVRRHIRETLHVYSDFELNGSAGDSGHQPSVRNSLRATEM
ncbi:uncharacterized protein B0H18DRAFT_1033734 [Fomitopsis serialis]|uniref:uncharacterized protein n=1 Tax=Fomitopsis serialis TaxID=139415 RepID=UPI002008D8D9|nr:uncharacterized protein B0H18DRAFT_1033734 [Neoantrodia serialis]KAH9917744.1 hypothetical protein B0H18DRAFT_1033734 [Neoantrodia serialis]